MLKKIMPVFLLFFLSFFFLNWGYLGHETINGKSPLSFPASMSGFGVWSDSLSINGSNADNRKSSDPTENPKHFIDIDSYNEFNTTGRIASTYDSVVAIHGETWVISKGTLPWATINAYKTLKDAFGQRQWHTAMLVASDLGHYVGDGHMPLHLTTNYDGQLTGQKGLHSRYESTMVSNYITQLSNYGGEPAHFVDNVTNYVFKYIYNNEHYVDSLLAADTYARNLAGNTTNSTYYSALWSKAKFTTTLFHNASFALAELIYSAWVEAGSPVYGSIAALPTIHELQVVVYPNPTKGIVNLVGDKAKISELRDRTGKLIGTYNGNKFDISNLNKGMYILNIRGEDGFTKKQKILLSD
jgi:hypothetical protein